MKHSDATHMVMAYSFSGSQGDTCDYVDTGEIGAGRCIVNWMRKNKHTEVVIFVVQYHSGQNLGPHRFELIMELAEECIGLI